MASEKKKEDGSKIQDTFVRCTEGAALSAEVRLNPTCPVLLAVGCMIERMGPVRAEKKRASAQTLCIV